VRFTGPCTGVGALLILSACYRYVPLESPTPPVGETVAFEITDRGRVELGDRLGTGVKEIHGQLVGPNGEDFEITVFRVVQLNGTSSQWSGETIRLDRDYVGGVKARELSKTRTWLLAAGVTATAVWLITSRTLSGLFNDEEPGPEPPPPTSVIKLRRGF